MKPSLLRNRQSGIKISSTLELLQKCLIVIEFGQQG
jgi:hypothetical protein